jgi:16S rRNA C1402 (ribose-2'-O) methylase RsmI
LLKQESIRILYRNRLKGKLTPLTGEIDTDWLKIKEAVTKAAEEIVGYKKWKNRKWLRTWKDEIQLAIEGKKASYRKYLQNKTVQHYIEYKKHREIVRKLTRRQRREDWDKFVKTLERDITGTQRRGFKIFKQLQLQERDKLKN